MPMLEPSHEKAERNPVMPERLERPTPTAPEKVDRTVERIGAERLLRQRGQPVHPGPHVGHTAGQVDPRARRRPDHRACTADSTRRSAALFTSRPTRTVAPQGRATSIRPGSWVLASDGASGGAATGSGSAIAGGGVTVSS